jgi:hypothetical protein
MKKFGLALGLTCASLIGARHSGAVDLWDAPGGHRDDNATTGNELASGSEQLHDLEAAGSTQDQDWYLVGQLPYSSYEVIVDGLTEDVATIPTGGNDANALGVDLVDSGGSLLIPAEALSSIGAARSLRFRNQTQTEVDNQFVRVMTGSGGCGTSCTVNSHYRVLMRDTTLMASRFNNSGSQTTILIVQNGGNTGAFGTARFFGPTGTLLGSQTFGLTPRGTFVLPTSTVPGVAGQSGSITIDHTARYGQLTGKAVALEPSTGFTFDTLVVPKFY